MSSNWTEPPLPYTDLTDLESQVTGIASYIHTTLTPYQHGRTKSKVNMYPIEKNLQAALHAVVNLFSMSLLPSSTGDDSTRTLLVKSDLTHGNLSRSIHSAIKDYLCLMEMIRRGKVRRKSPDNSAGALAKNANLIRNCFHAIPIDTFTFPSLPINDTISFPPLGSGPHPSSPPVAEAQLPFNLVHLPHSLNVNSVEKVIDSRLEGLQGQILIKLNESIQTSHMTIKAACEEDFKTRTDFMLSQICDMKQAEFNKEKDDSWMKERMMKQGLIISRMEKESAAARESDRVHRGDVQAELDARSAAIEDLEDELTKQDILLAGQASQIARMEWEKIETSPVPASTSLLDLAADMASLRKDFEGQKERSQLVNKRYAEEVKGLKEDVKGLKEENKGLRQEVEEFKDELSVLRLEVTSQITVPIDTLPPSPASTPSIPISTPDNIEALARALFSSQTTEAVLGSLLSDVSRHCISKAVQASLVLAHHNEAVLRDLSGAITEGEPTSWSARELESYLHYDVTSCIQAVDDTCDSQMFRRMVLQHLPARVSSSEAAMSLFQAAGEDDTNKGTEREDSQMDLYEEKIKAAAIDATKSIASSLSTAVTVLMDDTKVFVEGIMDVAEEVEGGIKELMAAGMLILDQKADKLDATMLAFERLQPILTSHAIHTSSTSISGAPISINEAALARIIPLLEQILLQTTPKVETPTSPSEAFTVINPHNTQLLPLTNPPTTSNLRIPSVEPTIVETRSGTLYQYASM